MREDKFGHLGSLLTGKPAEVAESMDTVRRPLSGMELLDDTYATITVRTAGGQALKVLANTSTLGNSVYGNTSTTNLIVQRVDESRQEKQQIIETFGEDFVYYYGQRPRMLQVSALLPDSLEFQYAQEFWTNYDRALRGTRLVTRDARIFLDIAGQIFEGYLSTAQTSRSADQPRTVQLNFTMYVTHSYYIRPLTNGKVSTSSLNGDLGNIQKQFRPYHKTMLGDYLRVPKTSASAYNVDSTDEPFDDKRRWPLAYNAPDGEVTVFDYITGSKDGEAPPQAFIAPETSRDVYAAKQVEESALSKALSEGITTGLAVVGGGLIVAGVVGAVVDGIQAEGGVGNYFNNRVLDPILDEIDTFLSDAEDIATGLVGAGYSIVEPGRSMRDSESGDVSDEDALLYVESPSVSNAPTPSSNDVARPQEDDFLDRVIL